MLATFNGALWRRRRTNHADAQMGCAKDQEDLGDLGTPIEHLPEWAMMKQVASARADDRIGSRAQRWRSYRAETIEPGAIAEAIQYRRWIERFGGEGSSV